METPAKSQILRVRNLDRRCRRGDQKGVLTTVVKLVGVGLGQDSTLGTVVKLVGVGLGQDSTLGREGHCVPNRNRVSHL